jgi:D-alanyl-lipoteichoic acid acyltransferase DltB (MBOAT superfamily)
MCLNLLIVFLVSGLWHGASWTFVIWGALHGVFLIVGILTGTVRRRIGEWTHLAQCPEVQRVWQIGTTFALVTFAWIFFRAETLSDATYIATHLFGGLDRQLASPAAFLAAVQGPAANLTHWLIAGAAILVMEAVHLLQRRGGVREWLARQPRWFRWTALQAALVVVVILGVYQSQAFIYFQF